MLLERFASLLARLVLCLSLLAAATGFAQEFKAPPPTGPAPTDEAVAPPLVPAEEPPSQLAPHGEVFPHEQKNEDWDTARFVGRLLLQPPAGILVGGAAGVATAVPVFILALIVCDVELGSSKGSGCFDALLYSATALGASIGAGLGVTAVGYLLDGKARVGATFAGALAGSAVGGAILLLSGTKYPFIPVMLVGPVLGATLAYALSDVFFPETTRAVAPANKDEDEYAMILPMISATRTGGIIGGLVGTF